MNLDEGRSLVAMPYSQQLNDKSTIERRFVSADGFRQMICDQFDVLYREGAESGRVMAIAVHPYLIGVPHRIGAFDKALEYICSHQRVWKATGAEIAGIISPSSRARRHDRRTRWARALCESRPRPVRGAASARRRHRDRGRLSSASANLWPIYIGIRKGFFAEADIAVDLVFSPSNSATIQQIVVNAINVSIGSGLVDPIRAIEKGAPVAILRIEVRRPPYALLGQPAIKDMKALAGKIVSVGGAKDITRLFLDRMLAANGVDPKRST